MSSKCERCGNAVPRPARFCPRCGSKVSRHGAVALLFSAIGITIVLVLFMMFTTAHAVTIR